MELQLGAIGLESHESVQTTKTDPIETYVPKICTKEWFSDEQNRDDEDDLKFYADYLYYKGDYSKALDQYTNLLQCPRFGSTRILLNEVYEAMALCAQKLKRYEEALQFCSDCAANMKSADHRTTNLYVKTRIIKEHGKNRDYLKDLLKQLILLHPFNHFLWLELSELIDVRKEKLVVLLIVRQLLDVNAHHLQSFVKEKHERLQTQVNEQIRELATDFDPDKVFCLDERIKEADATARGDDSWLQETYRINILDSGLDDIRQQFDSKWLSQVALL